MEVAPNVAKTSPEARKQRFQPRDNRIVRGIGRLPLPLGAKLIVGVALVAALLALVAALGLVALGRSNSRGVHLLRLQRKGVYFQLVLTDATQLKVAIENRINSNASTKRFGSGFDQTISNEFNQLCVDTGYASDCNGTALTPTRPTRVLTDLLPRPLFEAVRNSFFDFAAIDQAGPPALGGGVLAILRRTDKFATSFARELRQTARRTNRQADALVAANRHSYSHSRTVLLSVAGGSLALALALGLLLSWSVVAPLRRTQVRLSEIAGGDFGGHVEVPNRDEIGALAADVNRMNDELRRLYGELETASRHKSDFLATMSHELRTPLNAIIGFSEVLHEQMFGELNERQLAYVGDVLEAGKHLLSLINDVLDLAKIEAGKMELELSDVALADVLRSAVSMHSERASRNGIAISLTTEPAEIDIPADERRLRQIVFNLLSNAVKFTPPEGQVDISARLDDGHVEIAVADTGPGIAADEQETIFEEFEQATDGKHEEGTGLGLPLSRKLVELHGGRLWVESKPGHGSTFRFTLPVQQGAT
jgi:signal transduction histidine kinase